ncbi:MAG: FAD-dependent oxidoreductase, partial [Bacteroidia bacterium]|nr:FAD-dependent oxidoreductase [Bacteroidia bacterium]
HQLFPNHTFRVLEHRSGIRPTTKDRRPVVGQHPEFGFIYYLNGLGTKGVLLAPFTTLQLQELILNQKSVHPEISISRKNIQR